MEPKEITRYEEAMLQFITKASLKDHKDDIVVTNPSANRVYPKLVFVDDDQLIEFAQFEEMDANRFK